MNPLKIFSLQSRIAKRITELENEVKQLKKSKYDKNNNESYYDIELAIYVKEEVITELKSLI